MSRADRVAARLAGRRARPPARHDLVNVRYLTGYTGTNGLAVVGRADAPLPHRLPLRRAGEGAGPGLRPRDRAARAAPRARATAGRRARCAWASRTSTCPCARSPRCARRSRRGSSSCRPAGSSRRSGRARSPARSPRSAPPRRSPTRSTSGSPSAGVVGRTERALAIALEHEMRLRGAEPAFAAIVASGEHGAQPHAVPRDVPVAAGVLITLDMGARVDGYCSDCTRTWATGALSDELAALHATVLEAEQAGVAAVRPGPTGREVDAVARAVIEAAGLRRALRPRARPRRRARDPRGAAAGADRRDAAGRGAGGDRRAGHLRPRPRRGAGRGPGAGHRRGPRGAQRRDAGA